MEFLTLCLECCSLLLAWLTALCHSVLLKHPLLESPSLTTLSEIASADHPVLLPCFMFFPSFSFYCLSSLPKMSLLWQQCLAHCRHSVNIS